MSSWNPFEPPAENESNQPKQFTAPPPRVLFALLGIVGLVLFILIFSPLSLRNNGGDPLFSGGRLIVPEGYTVLSILVDDLQKPAGTEGPYLLTVPLLSPVEDDRNLGLYEHRGGQWQRLASASLSGDGMQASGEVADMPDNLVVMRMDISAMDVSGWLPAGFAPAAESLEALGTINPLGLEPLPDGGVTGGISGLPPFEGRVIPTVRASDPAQDQAVDVILASRETRDAHVRNLVQLSQQEGFAGVDIDYPRVNPELRGSFSTFIEDLAQELHAAGRVLTVTLPMPVRSGTDWYHGAYDWVRITSYANQVKLYSEVDPTLFHTRMPEVLDHLRRGVDMRKLSLVVGRESYERTVGGLYALTLYDALARAATVEVRSDPFVAPGGLVELVGRNMSPEEGASGLYWDDQALAVAFRYPAEDGPRTVWLENALSLSYKLDLAQRYGLGGVAITNVSDEAGLPDYWELVHDFGDTGEARPVQPNSVMLEAAWETEDGVARPDNARLRWTAPGQPGDYFIWFVVSDGVMRAAQQVVVTVEFPEP